MPHGNQGGLFRVTIIWLGLLLALPVQTLEAKQSIPQCIRVCKKGVIYYYFSTRGVDANPNYAAPPVRLRGPRSRTQTQRLSRPELERLIKEASHKNKLPPSLIKAVIRVESNFNPEATSPKGAMGMMQLMPDTASDLQVGDPYDSRENIHAGSRYLRMLLDKFNFHLPLALAAYNAGPERVKKHQRVPPIRETQAFVRNVCVNFLKYDEEKPK